MFRKIKECGFFFSAIFIIPMFSLGPISFLSIIHNRPASDDYCPAYSIKGGSLIGKAVFEYIDSSGRPIVGLVYGLLSDFNSMSLNFISSRFVPLLALITTLVLAFKLQKTLPVGIGKSVALLFVIAVLVGTFANGNLFITWTWMPGVIAHTLPTILASYLLLEILFGNMQKWKLAVYVLLLSLWVETALISAGLSLVLWIFTNKERFKTRAEVKWISLSFLSIILAVVSPGRFSKSDKYGIDLDIEELPEVILQAFVVAIKDYAWYVKDFPTIYLLIAGVLWFSKVTFQRKQLVLLLVVSTVTYMANYSLLIITAFPSYAKIDVLVSHSLSISSIVLLLKHHLSREYYKKTVSISFTLLLTLQFISVSSVGIQQLIERRDNWDRAYSQIKTAKHKGLNNMEYL